MAGIGVKLDRIFSKNSIAADLYGFGYSAVVTIAPMALVIGNILLMGLVLGFDTVGYIERELFSCTVLYIFIFSLLTASPFNAVLSKYMSDIIYKERYQDILPCYHVGLFLNTLLSCILGIPFCVWEYLVGHVRILYVFTGYCGYVSLMFVFYSMLYLSITKDYKRISFFFLIGMLEAFLLSLVLRFLFHWGITESMLFALVTGFFLTAFLENAQVRQYFRISSNRYKEVMKYFKDYWQLVATNFLYTLGLYIHNFVFWTTPMRMVLVDTFVCNQPYDMASCLAMFTNLTASVIFIVRVEMHFHERYKAYSEAVIGGKGADIGEAKNQMFRHLSEELMSLVRIQFIISVAVYLLFVVFLPRFGFGGLVMRIYPCLAAGYFILFLMYSEIIFLYYFDDRTGSVLTALVFCLGTFLGSIFATHLTDIWYGIGVVIGAFLGWTVAYFRLRWVERNLDRHVFCQGTLLPYANRRKPSGKVYDRDRILENRKRQNRKGTKQEEKRQLHYEKQREGEWERK